LLGDSFSCNNYREEYKVKPKELAICLDCLITGNATL
jgi:hypothetical protein